jgi:short-subunit dehydrogenase
MTARTALVTGASAGIGEAYATLLAEQGWDLILTARREPHLEIVAARLRERHNVKCLVVAADLADPTGPQTIIEAIGAQPVDALINNAGYGLSTTFRRTEWSEIESFLQVMVRAVTHLPHLLLPGMVERGYGRIVNVASLAAFAPEPVGSLYGAVKRYMVSMSKGLRKDVLGTGVHVTATCPGFTYTEFHDVLGNRSKMNRLPKVLWQDSRSVVEASWKKVETNVPVHVTGWPNQAIRALCQVVPEAMLGLITPKSISERGMQVRAQDPPKPL